MKSALENGHNSQIIAVNLMNMDKELMVKRTRGVKILVVEDNLINQKVARINLEMLGYEVSIAANGKEALAMYSQGYSLILMDVGLPDMDGLEITRRIRVQEKGNREHITIVAATANGEGYRQKCLAAGMDDFLNKPFLPNELKAMLDKYSCKLK